MKHLHTLLLGLSLALVSSASCLPMASAAESRLDQVVLLQHQEAALTAALGQDGLDLVEAPLIAGITAQRTSLADGLVHGAEVDQVAPSVISDPIRRAPLRRRTEGASNSHGILVHAAVVPHPMTGLRSTDPAGLSASWKVVKPLRCSASGDAPARSASSILHLSSLGA